MPLNTLVDPVRIFQEGQKNIDEKEKLVRAVGRPYLWGPLVQTFEQCGDLIKKRVVVFCKTSPNVFDNDMKRAAKVSYLNC